MEGWVLYSLVAIDLDGTLLRSDFKLSPRTVQAVRRAVERGVTVTLSTGRMFRSAQLVAREMGLAVPLITYNGAMVRNSGTGEIYHHSTVPLGVARMVVSDLVLLGLRPFVYVDDELYVAEVDYKTEQYCRVSGIEARAVGDLLCWLAAAPTKLLLFEQELLVARLGPELSARYRADLHVTRSWPYFLEIVRKGVSKGAALGVLTDMLGLARNEVMAIGDSFNDVEMFEYAGLGVAMGNAPEEVKRRADRVTLSNDEDGVACVLEEVILR